MTNPDTQEFEQLRRLLAVKRHEEPPPGYFHHFSREVIVRIKAGETGTESRPRNWAERIWAMLETKPAFAGAFGASVCAVLISGLLNSEDSAESAGGTAPVFSANGGFGVNPAMATAENVSAEPRLPSTSDTASLERLFDFQPAALHAVPVSSWSSNP